MKTVIRAGNRGVLVRHVPKSVRGVVAWGHAVPQVTPGLLVLVRPG